MMNILKIYNIALLTATNLQGVILPVDYDVKEIALTVTAMCCAESGAYYKCQKVNPNAISSVGALGVMQIKPKTAKDVLNRIYRNNKNVKSWEGDSALFNAEYCIYVGTLYLLYQYKRYDYNLDKAVHAYMQGSYPGNHPENGEEYVGWVKVAKQNLLQHEQLQQDITGHNTKVIMKASCIMGGVLGLIYLYNKKTGVK